MNYLTSDMSVITMTKKMASFLFILTCFDSLVTCKLINQNMLRIHTIRKVKFLPKNSILTKLQHFHEFFIEIFLTIFLVKSKLSTAKKSKTTTFSRVFHPQKNRQFFSWNQSCQQLKSTKPQHFHEFFTPKKSTIFSRYQSWIFGQKMKISNIVIIVALFYCVSKKSLWCRARVIFSTEFRCRGGWMTVRKFTSVFWFSWIVYQVSCLLEWLAFQKLFF